jgi:ribose transport system substrate-binding protein
MDGARCRFTAIGLAVGLLIGSGACQKDTPGSANRAPGASAAKGVSAQRVRLAFIPNAPSDFWQIARAGINKASKEFGVEVEVQIPGQGTAAQQKQIIEAMIAKGIQGMAISPLDPESQIEILNEAARHMPVVTQDSDVPRSNRVAYVGTNNVEAGRQAGRLIKDLLPKGGKIAVFVGKMDAPNARERYKGMMEEIATAGITVVEGRPFTDETSRPKAQENVAAVLGKYPDVSCLVGLWSYNGPAIMKVMKESKARVPVVCFDEETATLQGVREGLIQATVVQQPFEFGYQSIKLLTQLARGQRPAIPPGGLIYVPTRIIRKDNVDAFEKQLKEQMAQGKG